MRKYGIFCIACFSIGQGCKNPVTHWHCATKNFVKRKNYKPLLQKDSTPNFHSHGICVARWLASASGCAFLEFEELLHDA